MTNKPITEADWKLAGTGRMTDAQRRLLNAACADLSRGLKWHGVRMSKNSYRHFLAGVVLGARMVPSIDMGDGVTGFVMIERSSLELNISQATTAIGMAFYIGDYPSEQGIKSPRVQWCTVVRAARGISDADDRDAERYAA